MYAVLLSMSVFLVVWGYDLTIGSEEVSLCRSNLNPEIDFDESHCITNSFPVENFHEAWSPSFTAFGVAVPTSFSALDGTMQRIKQQENKHTKIHKRKQSR